MQRFARLTFCSIALAGLFIDPPATHAQPPVSEFRTFDGSANNQSNPTWGKSQSSLMRMMNQAYTDGISDPPSAGLPNPRAISNAVCSQPGFMVNVDRISSMFWQWGQFIDHDISRTPGHRPPEPFDVPVPTGDPFFDPNSTGYQFIFLQRSLHTTSGVREQINTITAFLDASVVYGSDLARANELRTLDGTGRLKTSDGDMMPFNVNQFDNDPDRLTSTFFLAGDQRSNEQLGLIAVHTLFVREHNHWATLLQAENPTWTDEQIYQMARAIVAAEIQIVTYKEFLPILLGSSLPPYAGYQASVDPSVANEFSTAAFRFGHTMLPPELLRLDSNMQPIVHGNVPLREAFFVPQKVTDEGGIDPLLRGLVGQAAQRLDAFIIDDVRNFLFGMPGFGGFDLPTLNIQRGRDHGLPRYNAARAQYGLGARTSFAEVTSDLDRQAALASVYPSVDEIDMWVGGLSEDPHGGALIGELFVAILSDQFKRLRDGDRFWYSVYLPASLVADLEAQTLADIIRRNTSIGSEIPDDVFHLPAALAVDPLSLPPGRLSLGLAFPNPATDAVAVDFTLGEQASAMLLTVHDAQGRQVRALLDGKLSPGRYRVRWDGRDARGQKVSPGVFFFHLRSGAEQAGRRFVVVGGP